jgi:hypothetical protein
MTLLGQATPQNVALTYSLTGRVGSGKCAACPQTMMLSKVRLTSDHVSLTVLDHV